MDLFDEITSITPSTPNNDADCAKKADYYINLKIK